MIIGIGTDIVSHQRIDDALARFGDRFLSRVLTDSECERARRAPSTATFLARRWAAKEAAAKALGVGIGAAANFHDIEVHSTDAGAPILRFTGNAADTAEALGANRFHISLSDERDMALAFVVLSHA